MIVYFFRHPITSYNEKNILMGHLDIEISDKGHEQLNDLLKVLNKFVVPDLIVSSDLLRCKILSKQLKRFFNCKFFYTKKLRETNFGKFQGESIEKFREEHKKMIIKNPKNWVIE